MSNTNGRLLPAGLTSFSTLGNHEKPLHQVDFSGTGKRLQKTLEIQRRIWSFSVKIRGKSMDSPLNLNGFWEAFCDFDFSPIANGKLDILHVRNEVEQTLDSWPKSQGFLWKCKKISSEWTTVPCGIDLVLESQKSKYSLCYEQKVEVANRL